MPGIAPANHAAKLQISKKVVKIAPGKVMFFGMDIGHVGHTYDYAHHRIFIKFRYKEIEDAEDIISAVCTCKFCLCSGQNSNAVKNHTRSYLVNLKGLGNCKRRTVIRKRK